MLDLVFDHSARVPGFMDQYVGVDNAALPGSSELSSDQRLVRIQNLHRLELITQILRVPVPSQFAALPDGRILAKQASRL